MADKNPEYDATSENKASDAAQASAPGSIDPATSDVAQQWMTQMMQMGGMKLFLSQQDKTPQLDQLQRDLNLRLAGLQSLPLARHGGQSCIRPINVAFPQCSDVLLALINTKHNDDATRFFKDYFRFCDHNVVAYPDKLSDELDEALLNCTQRWYQGEALSRSSCGAQEFDTIEMAAPGRTNQSCTEYKPAWPPTWPPPWCLPPSCVTLEGTRPFNDEGVKPLSSSSGPLRRLFIADAAWLFYMEWMGIFKILGAILDDFACTGELTLDNGSRTAGTGGVVPLVLEAMTRNTESGSSSRLRQRESTYRRSLGWTIDPEGRLGCASKVNTRFSAQFHSFIYLASNYYKYRYIGTAVQGIAQVGSIRVPTLGEIADTLTQLKTTFEYFDYGRNHAITLNGIIWVIAAMALIRELRGSLKIPAEYDSEYEYIAMAYNALVRKDADLAYDPNRYLAYRGCANSARQLVLGIEAVNQRDPDELELFLDVVEHAVESYRKSYQDVTGIDLRAEPQTKQQA